MRHKCMQTKGQIFFYKQQTMQELEILKYSHRNPRCKIDQSTMISMLYYKFRKQTKKKSIRKTTAKKLRKHFKIFNKIKRNKINF